MKTKWNPVPLLLFSVVQFLFLSNIDAQLTGSILEDAKIYAGLPEASFSISDLPARKDLSGSFPRPRDQGRQGSCVGWACAYALKTHQEQMERQWGLRTFDRIFSPAFIYNQINKGVDKGSRISDALQYIQANGAALWSSFPYDDSDHTTQPSRFVRQNALRYRISKFYKIDSADLRDPRNLKEKIASGYPLIASINVDRSFMRYDGGVFDEAMGDADDTHGRHAICIVGYDDSSFSFKLINSWGTDWGEDGYMRIGYDTLIDRLNQAFFAVDRRGDDDLKIDPDSPWLFDSDKRRLPPNQLGYLSVETLWRARNEIFARRGYIFTTPRGKKYAQSLGNAYRGRFNHDQTEERFNEFEEYNIAQIIAIEYGRGDRIGSLPGNKWVFSDSNIRRLTLAEVSSASKETLWKARNEIFARRGYRFQTAKGKAFGRSLGALYAPLSGDMDRIYETFNAIERYNVDLIKAFETGGARRVPVANRPARNPGVWIFPNSDREYLTVQQLSGLPREMLWKARNEIFARRGYIFKTDKGKAYARSLGSAYTPRSSNVYNSLNKYESKNIELIKRFE